MVMFKNPMAAVIEDQIEDWEYQLELLCDDLEDYTETCTCECCGSAAIDEDAADVEDVEEELQDCLVMLGYWYEQLEIAKGV